MHAPVPPDEGADQTIAPVGSDAHGSFAGVIDGSVISDLASLGGAETPSFLASTITAYLDHAASLLAQLTQAIRGDDGEAASRTAHSLRGSSATLGARSLAELCARVEEAPLGTATEEDVAAIGLEFERVGRALLVIRDAEGADGATR
ncbi:MAG: Hpt domain-containing protein [Acidimicrobiales bacterium]